MEKLCPKCGHPWSLHKDNGCEFYDKEAGGNCSTPWCGCEEKYVRPPGPPNPPKPEHPRDFA